LVFHSSASTCFLLTSVRFCVGDEKLLLTFDWPRVMTAGAVLASVSATILLFLLFQLSGVRQTCAVMSDWST